MPESELRLSVASYTTGNPILWVWSCFVCGTHDPMDGSYADAEFRSDLANALLLAPEIEHSLFDRHRYPWAPQALPLEPRARG